MVAQFWTHFRASMGGAVAAQQGFPDVVGRSTSSDADGGDVAVALPDGIETGQLLIVAVTCSTVDSFVWPEGWTELVAANHDFATTARSEIRYRYVDGSEGLSGADDSITVTTGAAAAAALAWAIMDHDPNTAPSVHSIMGFGANVNLTAHDPSAWDVEKTLWLAFLGNDGNRAITFPDTHPLARRTLGLGAAATGVTISAAEARAALASLDQGAWTIASTEAYLVASIAIRPAA